MTNLLRGSRHENLVGAGSASFEIMRDLAKKLPFMFCPRWARRIAEA